MLKIDVIRFEAQDVITTSVPVAEEEAPDAEEKAPENNTTNESGIPKPEDNNGEGENTFVNPFGCDCPENHFHNNGSYLEHKDSISCFCETNHSYK